MKGLIAVLLLCILIGCGDQRTTSHSAMSDDNNAVSEEGAALGAKNQPQPMPGGIGISSGQTGTGTTSGLSGGY